MWLWRLSLHRVCCIVVAAIAINIVEPHPYGAPYKSCANLYPKHAGAPAETTSPPPYSIDVSDESYSSDDILTVTLRGQGSSFRGFLLVVNRVSGDTEENIGNFISLPEEANKRFWYPANADDTNCVTHRDNLDKTEVTLQWQAPSAPAVPVVFRCTFVQSVSVFWVDVKSEVIQGTAEPEPCQHCFLPDPWDFSQEECGKTRGCLLYPNLCSGARCRHAITWEAKDDGIHFAVKANSNGYFTFAISKDRFMNVNVCQGEDHAITCVNSGDFVSVQLGFNPAYYNDRHRAVSLREVQTQRIGDNMYARWIHPYDVIITHLNEQNNSRYLPPTAVQKHFNMREPWHVFLAWGKLYPGADVLYKHTELPLISDNMVEFSSTQIVFGSSLPVYVKAHGIGMLIAWMLLAGIAKTIARNFQGKLGSAICGKQSWFQIHRFLAVLTFLVTTACFILIFVMVGKWSTFSSGHAGVGVAVMGTVLLQVMSGLLRPSPDSTHRVIFNVFHRICAQATHILSLIAMFYITYSDVINGDLRLWMTIILSIFVGLEFIFEAFVFSVIKCKSSPKVEENSPESDSDKKATFTVEENACKKQTSPALVPAFVVYVICLMALTAAAVATILVF